MKITTETERPIFMQISDGIEDAILSGGFPEESQIPSITEFSVMYKINPATALKGISRLVDDETLYKKRGVGMFVAIGAAEKLKMRRHEEFFERYIKEMLEEAKRLGLDRADIIKMIESGC